MLIAVATTSTVDEVAATIPGTREEDVDYNRDIVLRYKHGGLRHLSHIHPLYHPLHYVLLFPKGDQGWHRQIEIVQLENGTAGVGPLALLWCQGSHGVFP